MAALSLNLKRSFVNFKYLGAVKAKSKRQFEKAIKNKMAFDMLRYLTNIITAIKCNVLFPVQYIN